MPEQTRTPDTSRLHELMSRYGAGHDGAGESLCSELEPALRKVADGFLGANDPDRDDLVQDALIALLAYLRAGGSLPDNPHSFASTIIRNRCRNLYRWRKYRPSSNLDNLENWYKSPDSSALDLLLEDEVLGGLQAALDRLDDTCAQLLRGIYLEGRSMEDLSRQLGLKTVQAVYYRRNQCLQRIKKIFEKIGFESPAGGKLIRMPKRQDTDHE
jgi:RNA polymerase sigma factor (sigma-70 family)